MTHPLVHQGTAAWKPEGGYRASAGDSTIEVNLPQEVSGRSLPIRHVTLGRKSNAIKHAIYRTCDFCCVSGLIA